MTKKQIRIYLVLVQAVLVVTLFLPAGRAISADGKPSASVSVFGMIRRYAGMGFSNDALVYMVLSCLLPVLIVAFLFFLKERFNYGTAACLSALYSLAAACFFSAAKRKMVDSVTMTGLHYVIVLLTLVSILLSIGGFLSAHPGGGNGERREESSRGEKRGEKGRTEKSRGKT